ncbi:reverse transcriptase domain-containing protein [Tanacetum coccineum]
MNVSSITDVIQPTFRGRLKRACNQISYLETPTREVGLKNPYLICDYYEGPYEAEECKQNNPAEQVCLSGGDICDDPSLLRFYQNDDVPPWGNSKQKEGEDGTEWVVRSKFEDELANFMLENKFHTKGKLEKATSSVKLSEECSAIIQRNLPQKEGDPGSFTLPCLIRPLAVKNVMADLGAKQWVDIIDHDGKWAKVEEEGDSNEVQVVSFYPRTKPVEPLGWKAPKNRLKPSSIEPPKLELKELPEHLDPWVSLVQVVPKKGGMAIVTNEKNELIPQRTVTGWRVCIDYRKLNNATRKDHFPLLFIDQMLERLAGQEYYCFLKGFSGYFLIPIALEDQEKTTFTCPYGTFAYKQIPFGLCNAPATCQRCMTTIFHELIEDSMDVFMDDFSVFGNSFDHCLKNLKKMLKRCEETNLMLNWEKCHFMILLLQEFDIKIRDKKGAENLAADHLFRLENPDLGKLTKAEIRDLFPEERLMAISNKNNGPRLLLGKLKSRWYGPFSVRKDLKNGAIELYDKDGNVFIINKQRVKPYQKDVLETNKHDDITLDDEGEVTQGRVIFDEKKLGSS